MDGGPLRGQQPNERRAAADRPMQTRVQHDARSLETPSPQPTHRTVPHQSPVKRSSPSRLKLPLIILAIMVLVGAAGWFGWANSRAGIAPAIDNDKYQAVFFTNGQVYFGKLDVLSGDYLQLTDIYYLQTQTTNGGDSENPQTSGTADGDFQLIKLGEEIHGPEDQMVISKEQVLFFENLKVDGQVAQSIENFKNQ